jgi:hypothetical protein
VGPPVEKKKKKKKKKKKRKKKLSPLALSFPLGSILPFCRATKRGLDGRGAWPRCLLEVRCPSTPRRPLNRRGPQKRKSHV